LTAAGTLVAATYRLTVSVSTEHAGTHELGLYDPALPLGVEIPGRFKPVGLRGLPGGIQAWTGAVSIGQVMGLDAVVVC
jgi:hypothetical protein